MSALRMAALDVAGVERRAPEFAEAFNLATGVALEAVTQEWWASHVVGDKPRFLSPEAFRKVFEMLAEYLSFEARKDEQVGIDLERRFGVLAAVPKVWAAVNYFDYFVTDRDLLMARLVRAVSAQAEIACARFCDRHESEGANVLRRMLSLSSALMVEVYKECAARDVEELRSLSVADRSVRLAMAEGVGLAYDHVLDAHEEAVQRAMDLADLVSEAQPASA